MASVRTVKRTRRKALAEERRWVLFHGARGAHWPLVEGWVRHARFACAPWSSVVAGRRREGEDAWRARVSQGEVACGWSE